MTGENEKIIEEIEQAILEFDKDKATQVAQKAVDNGVDPVKALNEGVRPALDTVGKKFEEGEFFIIHLAAAGEAASEVINKVLRPEIEKKGEHITVSGKYLIGTVAGDIHEIGKTIVKAMLLSNGFDVVDIGMDIPTETFVEEVKKQKPDILGLSALLSTTIPAQKDVIEALKEAGLRDQVKIMVGGAPVTQEWADQIGADAYGADAIDAVEKAKKLMGQA
ncbi:MAG: cobalamin B12-binding domain-containing protein [Halobacteriota archaeon]